MLQFSYTLNILSNTVNISSTTLMSFSKTHKYIFLSVTLPPHSYSPHNPIVVIPMQTSNKTITIAITINILLKRASTTNVDSFTLITLCIYILSLTSPVCLLACSTISFTSSISSPRFSVRFDSCCCCRVSREDTVHALLRSFLIPLVRAAIVLPFRDGSAKFQRLVMRPHDASLSCKLAKSIPVVSCG